MKRWVSLLLLLVMTPIQAQAEDDPELPVRHHPVEVMIPGNMQLPDEMKPDDRGRIICNTCHGIDNIEKKPRDELNKKDPDFLHGGPYRDLTKFCFRCHDDAEFQRKNIHIQRLKSGKTDKTTCQYCHEEQPDPNNRNARDDLKLRLPPGRICLGCHLKTPHLNAMLHQQEPDDTMRDYLHRIQDEQGVRMPLDESGKITCITCHTPHQKGVIPADQPGGRQVAESRVEDGVVYSQSKWAPIYATDKEQRLAEFSQEQGRPFALEYKRLAKEVLLRLPAKDGTLCQACHRFKD